MTCPVCRQEIEDDYGLMPAGDPVHLGRCYRASWRARA